MTAIADYLMSRRICLSRVFGAAFFLLLAVTTSSQEGSLTSAVLFLGGLVLIGFATVGRVWCALYIAGYKNKVLITSGPYSISRNPLYFFSSLGFAGIGMATETISLALASVAFFALLYPGIIRREEEHLLEKFGAMYKEYSNRTPRFWPDFSLFHEPGSFETNPRRFRRTAFAALWFVWLVGIIELVEAFHEYGWLHPLLLLP
jgi:protein-S-isoprenylcysteine O-methyltransferase Ste14